MANDFAKVYRGLFTGSLADSPPYAKLLLIAMLLDADHNGQVQGSASYWAGFTNISVENAQDALELLQSPDPDSQTPDEEGRRIVALGANRWQIVNYAKYREMNLAEERREANRIRKARQRSKPKPEPEPIPDKLDIPEPPPRPPKAVSRETFVPPTLEECCAYFVSKGKTPSDARAFFDHFDNRATKKWHTSQGRGPLMSDWKRAADNWGAGKFLNGQVEETREQERERILAKLRESQ